MICTGCHRELRIAECTNVRAWVCGDFLYALLAECRDCGSTRAWVIWEMPDEQLLLAGELGPLSHERDAREVA